EIVAELELALCGELRHAGRRAGAAWRPVDRFVAVEHRIARMRPRLTGLARPHDVAHAPDGRVVGMNRLDLLVHKTAHDRRPSQDVAGRYRLQAGEILLRLDDGVEVTAIGDVEHQLAHARDVDRDLARRQVRGDVGEAYAFDETAVLLVARH